MNHKTYSNWTRLPDASELPSAKKNNEFRYARATGRSRKEKRLGLTDYEAYKRRMQRDPTLRDAFHIDSYVDQPEKDVPYYSTTDEVYIRKNGVEMIASSPRFHLKDGETAPISVDVVTIGEETERDFAVYIRERDQRQCESELMTPA